MTKLALRKGVKTSSKPPIVTEGPSRHPDTGQNGEIWDKLGHFSRITRPKEGVLKGARPAQTRPNGQIPVQKGGIAGL